MNTRLDWFDDFVKLAEQKAKERNFPGEPSVLYPILDKLINKLYGECHNGGKVGEDGCPTCRAHKTEKAESERDSALATLKKLAGEKAKLVEELSKSNTLNEVFKGKLGEAEEANLVLAKTVEDLGQSLQTHLDQLSSTIGEKEYAQNLASRLRAAVNEKNEELSATKARLEKLNAVVERLKEV